MSTLKTWVADHHQNDPYIMAAIQTNVAHSTPENPQSRTLQQEVINNPEDERYFGKTFPSITDVELAFLQEVKRKGQEKPVNSLEIAAGSGLVSWKTLFALSNAHGGTHHANELSSIMIDEKMKPMLSDVFSNSYPPNTMMEIIPGDCFHVLSHLYGTIDVLYVQNLEHFFNPKQHQAFIDLVENLLAPDGKAILCASTFRFGTDPQNPLRILWNQRKKAKDLYPGFASYRTTFKFAHEVPGLCLSPTIHDGSASRPQDDEKIGDRTLSCTPSTQKTYIPALENAYAIHEATQQLVCNYFSPGIYKRIVEQRPNLTYVDGFWTNNHGYRLDKWSDRCNWAAAIIQKN